MAIKTVSQDDNILNYGLRDIAFQKLDGTGKPTSEILMLRDVKSFTIDVEEGDSKDIWTNDKIVYSMPGEGATTGTLTVLRFPDEFLIDVLGQEQLADGSLIDGTVRNAFNIFWKVQGDKEVEIRAVKNVIFGKVQSQEYNTYEGDVEERNETVGFSVIGEAIENDPKGRIQKFARYTYSKNPDTFSNIYKTGLPQAKIKTSTSN